MEISLVPLIMAIIEAVKQFNVPSKFLPWLAMLLGVGFSFFTKDCTPTECVVEGMVIGLTAAGLYDATLKPIRKLVVKKKASRETVEKTA